MHSQTTIAAIATPPGRGGVGVIRLSGPKAYDIAQKLTQKTYLKLGWRVSVSFMMLMELLWMKALSCAFQIHILLPVKML